MPEVADRPEPFELLASHVALDFVNTLDNRFDPDGPLELVPSFDRLVEFCQQAGLLAPQDAARLRRDTSPAEARRALDRALELREALFALFDSLRLGAPSPAAALRTLNEALLAKRPSRVVAWDGTRYVWRTEPGDVDAGSITGPIARAAADLLTSPESPRVRECGAASCRWLFLDRSRNHSRRWCDMKICGNRNKARRFHARH